MKNIILKLTLGVIALLGFSSCENFLTQTNPNQVTVDNFWEDLNDTDKGLTAVYAGFRNHFIMNTFYETLRSDQGWPSFGRPSVQSNVTFMWYSHQYNNGTTEVINRWTACYTLLFRANQVITALENIKGDIKDVEQDRWDNQMGQALFFRGLMHFYLYEAYNEGSVVLALSVPKSVEDYYKALSTPQEVRDSFTADLLKAYELLPEKQDAKARPSAGAAATILGTSYLYEGEYEEAMKYFDDVIDNKAYGYALDTKGVNMFDITNEYNSESILEIEYNTEMRPELSLWSELRFTNRWSQMFNGGGNAPAWINYEYTNEQMDPKDKRNYYTDADGVEQLRNVALRGSAMCVLAIDEQTPYYKKPTAPEGWGLFQNINWGLGNSKKLINGDSFTSEENRGEWKSGKNVVVNRLAGVYLMRAECRIKTNNVQGALDDINKIRARWGLVLLGSGADESRTYDEVSYTAEELMDRLMYIEKPLELWQEGFMTRWIDMRRWEITADRFADLASRTYYAESYQIKVPYTNGTTPLIPNCKIVEQTSDAKAITIDYEYKQAAVNYNPKAHDYYGIPIPELANNSNIN